MRKVWLAGRQGYLTPPVLIILALITLFVAITLYINAYFAKSAKNKTLPSPSPTVQKQSSPTLDESANWKVYSNKKVGYTFKYPTGWQYRDCVDLTHFKGVCFFSQDYVPSGIKHPDNYADEIDVPNKGLAISIVTTSRENLEGKLACEGIATTEGNVICEEITIDRFPAIKITQERPDLKTDARIIDIRATVLVGDNSHQIFLTYSKSDDQNKTPRLFNQILSTFKFID